MQEPKIKPIFFSMVGGVIISILFLMITFWIFYTYSTSPAAAKDALSTTAGFFGGVATLWAACIATYLFNDWREQKKYVLVSTLALEAHQEFIHARDKFSFYIYQHIYQIPPISYKEVDDEVFRAVVKANLLNDILIRFKYQPIKPCIDQFYKQGYCKLPVTIHNPDYLKAISKTQLDTFVNKAFSNYEILAQELLRCIEIVNKK